MKIVFTHTFKALALGLILAASVHSAQATPFPAHTYVSGVGDDANPCSRTAPCATFAGAISKTAAGGVITALNSGDYGQVTIAKAVTIDGTGTQASIVLPASAGNAITINDSTATDTIILRHLTLTGIASQNGMLGQVSNGVTLTSGNLMVDDCKISGFSGFFGSGINLNGSGNAVVENTTMTGCFSGILNSGTGLLSLRNVTLHGNILGLNVSGGATDISHSQITQNSDYGLYAFQSTLSASGCMISGNGTGVDANTGSIIRLINNDILNNTTGINTSGSGAVSTTSDNRKAGNTTSGSVTPGKVITQQ